jgi:hypothetical protein
MPAGDGDGSTETDGLAGGRGDVGDFTALGEWVGRGERAVVGFGDPVGGGLGECEGAGDAVADPIGAPSIGFGRGGGEADVEVLLLANVTTAVTPISTIAVAMPTMVPAPGRGPPLMVQPAARCRGRYPSGVSAVITDGV